MHQALTNVIVLIRENSAAIDPSSASAAQAAWQAVRVYWFAFGASLVGLALSGLIAFIAVSGPDRDRHTRDLEIRKARARLNKRSAHAALRGLRTINGIQRYYDRRKTGYSASIEVISRYIGRCTMRIELIEHYLNLEIRDLELVSNLIEVKGLLRTLLSKMDFTQELELGLGIPIEPTNTFLAFKAKQRKQIEFKLKGISDEMDRKDASLQRDLDLVWSWRWFWPFDRSKFFGTKRD